MPSANLTIRDVAKRAGVSHQTISRVINGAPPATAETRAIAEAAIDRVLAAGRGQTLACLAPNLTRAHYRRHRRRRSTNNFANRPH